MYQLPELVLGTPRVAVVLAVGCLGLLAQDKSGQIEFGEFEGMIKSLIGRLCDDSVQSVIAEGNVQIKLGMVSTFGLERNIEKY